MSDQTSIYTQNLDDENERLRKLLKKAYDALQVVWEYDGDVFGVQHNTVVDIESEIETELGL